MNGERLYDKMAKVYRAINLVKGAVPSFSDVTDISGLSISPSGDQAAEGATIYKAADAVKAKAVSTKGITINFPTGSYTLDANAKMIVDMKFTDIIQMSTNMIRIEGNTDDVGSREGNMALSKKRAQAVKDYLVQKHDVSTSRISTVGNGSDKPIGDNSTEEGKEKNRRIDLLLLD
jgi:NitT/TauT family transport system substrate-binding protein